MVLANAHAQLMTAIDERCQDSSCLVGHWKELACFFTLEVNTQRGKPLHGLLDGKRGEYILDDVAIAEEIGWCYNIVRDVAASPAGDEDLGPYSLGPIEEHYHLRTIARRGHLCRENRCRQPGGARTNHRNIMHVVI